MNKIIMHIVGNRPQFIKLAPVSREIRKRGYREVIIHTGQHFDANMSDIFFEELNIPKPDVNLHISGGSHTDMTARMMLALEKTLIEYNPAVVVLYGDTNSTLAAALTARKLNLRIAHVEAGPRTGSWTNPEEINRIVTDRISDMLFAPDQTSMDNLAGEGLAQKAYFTGDVMYDSYLYCQKKTDAAAVLAQHQVQPGGYVLMTWHRQENTSDKARMEEILRMIKKIDTPVLYPMHPRTRKMLQEYGLFEQAEAIENLHIIEPVGYQEMVALSSNCRFILTDSGGLSKESFYAGVKCLFMMNDGVSVWKDLEKSRLLFHVPDEQSITEQLLEECSRKEKGEKPLFYGDGNAAAKIVDVLEKGWQSEEA
jgi:UDP-N-acetylglucosamine 2-epimerase